MKRNLFFLFFAFLGFSSFGQNFNMLNGTASTCMGQFFDSGGPEGNYQGGEDYVFVINSGMDSAKPEVRFLEFKLSGHDWLAVYDGNSNKAKLIGNFNIETPVPSRLRASGNSLTFVFHSDQESSGAGWRAHVVCQNDVQKHAADSIFKGAYILRYSIQGLKAAKDARLIESNLVDNEMIFGIKVGYKNSLARVSVNDESLYDVIAGLLSSSEEYLGYHVEVKFLGSMRNKVAE